ncbi:MSHA pilin protein MshD [Pseudoduganella lurida]|uniref:MSHA pilin protein MshD n=1 Tax=Pseudoduganella lurida TaxID=1036180 RepID=A0A562RLW5_9BURK|nr:prepilin-type N-terminal cleavage/methylation domain-containing protein [Pseudoduganella lurida]TWI69446.1 MSHA pilin protein MshD [Pseudoduganella lurida]
MTAGGAHAPLPRQRGLTLIELIMFIVIVGVAVIGVLQVITMNTARSADPMRRKQAMAIAEALVDEIRAARFSWCDVTDPNYSTATSAAGCTIPEGVNQEAGGGARPFDNVNDYVQVYGTPLTYTTDVIGTPFPAGYAATVTITQPPSLGPAGATVPQGAVLRILVNVAYGNEAVTLETYRTRYAPNN